jgi:hypothetical protein
MQLLELLLIVAKNADRFYLEEYWYQRPGLNAVNIIDPDADDASALAVTQAANKNFEVLGTNMTTALCTFNSTAAGIILTTAGADQDQAIVLPHLDTNQTIWSGTKWGTENQVEWECSINTNAIDNQKVWAGLKLTNDQLVATDDDQAFLNFKQTLLIQKHLLILLNGILYIVLVELITLVNYQLLLQLTLMVSF